MPHHRNRSRSSAPILFYHNSLSHDLTPVPYSLVATRPSITPARLRRHNAMCSTPSSNVSINSGIDEPISRPYAPVSSDVSHISVTPSDRADCKRAASTGNGYEPSLPRACTVLQYVHAPRQPVLQGMISTRGFLRILGSSRDGREDLPRRRTIFPFSASCTTSTTRPICWTPTIDRPERLSRSGSA